MALLCLEGVNKMNKNATFTGELSDNAWWKVLRTVLRAKHLHIKGIIISIIKMGFNGWVMRLNLQKQAYPLITDLCLQRRRARTCLWPRCHASACVFDASGSIDSCSDVGDVANWYWDGHLPSSWLDQGTEELQGFILWCIHLYLELQHLIEQ